MENKMKQIIEDTILHGSYKLQTKLFQIDEQEIKGNITKEEKEYLVDLAREHAQRENEYAKDFNERLEELERKTQSFEEWKEWLLKNSNIEIYYQEDNEEPTEEEVVEEYPEYVKPTGGHDAHMKGYKTTYKGKKFISLIDNNVWTPDEYPQGWKEVI